MLTPETLRQAARRIDQEGISKDNVWSQYYVVVDGKGYQFKYLVYLALELIGITDVNFESNTSYRNYIEVALGFEMRYYPDGYNFFTRDELDYFSSIVNRPYRTDDADTAEYPKKIYPLITKLNYWGSKIAEGDYKFKPDRSWLTNWTANIKPYIWPRIYKGSNRDIFFNVEINGNEGFIGYKLDGYYETTKRLSPEGIEILNEFKHEFQSGFVKISFADIGNYNWDSLIAATKAYVAQLDDAYDLLRKRLYKESRPAVLSWNTNGWVSPSGIAGKSKADDLTNNNLFSMDEWLFNSDQVIDGYKYGFLKTVDEEFEKFEGRVFDIPLFTENVGNGLRYWVATLKNVEILNREESGRMFEQFRRSGGLDTMEEDLIEVGIAVGLKTKTGEEIFNVRFKADQLRSLPLSIIELVEAQKPSEVGAVDVNEADVEQYWREGFSFDDSGSSVADLKKKGKRKSYTVEKEMEFKHNRIQEQLLAYLQQEHSKAAVKRECRAYGGCRIDLVRKTETGFIFYEIKTYNSLLTSLRLGIGQLLEYSLFPQEHHAEKLVLVSDQQASPEVESYIRHLKGILNLDFSYIYFDLDSNRIVSEI